MYGTQQQQSRVSDQVSALTSGRPKFDSCCESLVTRGRGNMGKMLQTNSHLKTATSKPQMEECLKLEGVFSVYYAE